MAERPVHAPDDQELREIKKKSGEISFFYNWMGPDARATADRIGVNSPRPWCAMHSVRGGRPATSQPGYASLLDAQKGIAHDLFKVPRPKELKGVDASAE